MKLLFGLLLLSVASFSVLALPAGTPSDDAEVIDVPRRHLFKPPNIGFGDQGADDDFVNFRGTIDTGVDRPTFFAPRPSVFSFNLGLLDSFEELFRRFRPSIWGAEDTGTSAGLDPKKTNSTSTVEIINGHKVEVNETVYGDDNTRFRVRMINVRPLDSEETVPKTNTNTDTDTDTDTYTKPDAAGKPGYDDKYNPVTSGPDSRTELGRNDDSSDERREPLDETYKQNEIHAKTGESKKESLQPQKQYQTMLPTTETNDDANLNGAFVADNGLVEDGLETTMSTVGNGNFETETNKPENNEDNSAEKLENYSALAEEHNAAVESSLLAAERLTIENNEEAEVNDSFNESSHIDGDRKHDNGEELDDSVSGALSELDMLDHHEDYRNVGVDSELGDGEDVAVDGKSSKYSAMHKERENVGSWSSDEENADGVHKNIEMSAAFNSEWGNLAEDLATANEKHNDFENEIDVYDTVPVDLSNDIAVNDIAASQPGYPVNPDAEFIDAEHANAPTGPMPMAMMLQR